MAKLALTGGAYQARSLIASAQRSCNLYAEPLPEAQGEPSRFAHHPTPGLRRLSSIGPGPIRGIRQATTGGVYVVSGSEVYSVNTSSWAGTLLGTITAGLRTPVSMADNGLDLVIVDGTSGGWSVGLAGNTFAAVSDPGGMFSGADRVDYLDTYFLLNKPGTPQFYISGSLAVTFDTLDFANKSTYPDLLVTLAVAKREVYLLGERTTEIWYDAGATDTGASSFPFAQTQGVFIDHGIVAKYSVANYDNGLFWLSRDRQGQGIMLEAADYKTKRVSTYAIEAEIAGYARIDDAVGYCYALGGHAFYVLTFPHADHTWAYDITTGLWHEWVWIDVNGAEHRHRSNCHAAISGLNVVGDWQNGNLYALDNRVFTDNGQPIKRVRSFPHVLADGRRVFYREFIADMDTGNTATMLRGELTLIDAKFTAPDGTPIEDYVSEVGGGWSVVGGEASAEIEGNRLVGTGGDALYQSAAVMPVADYALRFSVVPSGYDAVVADTSLWAIGRATGAGTGYQATVTADGAQYALTLAVLAEGGASASVVMGTLSSGVYTVWLDLRGSRIAARVQRTQDGLWLRDDGIWQASAGTTAAQFTDSTYTAPGSVMIGGSSPEPPVDVGTLTSTMETILSPDPNFPAGYTMQGFGLQTFDFGRNRLYVAVNDTSIAGGLTITDTATMAVTRTVKLAQMYAGTPYGLPPGSPPSQDIYGLVTGSNSDVYMLTAGDPAYSPAGEFCRFARVDPVTMKVTGEFYASKTFPPPITCVMPSAGESAVNTTATHTIVAYKTNGALSLGPQIFDGTNMAPIGMGPAPTAPYDGYQVRVIAGAKRGDGSCDFIMVNPDWASTPSSGNIEIYRINVTDGLAITNTHTGTLHTAPYFPAPGYNSLFVGQIDYDPVHDCMIMCISNVTGTTAGPPNWLVSVNYDGSVNWWRGPLSLSSSYYEHGQYRLTGGTYMLGASDVLTLFDTATGDITFTGSITVSGGSAGSFYRVWDAVQSNYYTFALSRGHVRVHLEMPEPASLAMDDVVCAAEAGLSSNLISLSYSDDRGHSWSNPISQGFGAAGEYKRSLLWRRLGYARDRAFSLEWSVAAPTALQGCFLTAEPADATGGEKEK